MRSVPALALILGLVAAPACRRPTPEGPPVHKRDLPALEIARSGKWLFTYADDSGRFVTTDDAEAVPAPSRALVRVLDPSLPAQERRDGVAVYVVDVNEPVSRGRVSARVLSREAFETGALAQLAPGAFSVLPPPGPAGQAAPEAPAAPATGSPPATPGGPAVVTLYGTSWCGACRAARTYLAGKRIPFADKDIERDPAAASELRDKARRLGISADRVPILDVRGRLLIGFDKDRLEALLGEAS